MARAQGSGGRGRRGAGARPPLRTGCEPAAAGRGVSAWAKPGRRLQGRPGLPGAAPAGEAPAPSAARQGPSLSGTFMK